MVLMGDLNEWRLRRRSALQGFAKGFGPLGLGVPSFPAFFPVLALDRVLTRPHGLIEEIAAHQTPLSRLASDHLPVRAVVRLDATASAGARPPPAARRRRPRSPPMSRRAALATLAAARRARPASPRPMFPSAGPTPTTTATSPTRRRSGFSRVSSRCLPQERPERRRAS